MKPKLQFRIKQWMKFKKCLSSLFFMGDNCFFFFLFSKKVNEINLLSSLKKKWNVQF